MAQLGVVIPTVGRTELLGRALARLERQRILKDEFEVVVVHSTTTDAQAVQDAVGSRPYAVRRLVSQRGDASSQRNIGWRALDTPVILFLGDDILASPWLVGAHLEAHRRRPEPEAGVVGRVSWPRWPPPTPFMRWLERGIQFDFRELTPGAEVGWWHFYTANASVKRAMLEQVGGFDEMRFPFLYEDLDLAARMSDLGFRLGYEPRAAAAHLHPQTLADWQDRIVKVAAAERRFCARHPHAQPYFHTLFSEAAARPPSSGHGVKLARLIPPRVPWLGPRTWASFDLWHRQQLAPAFFAAWGDAEGDGS